MSENLVKVTSPLFPGQVFVCDAPTELENLTKNTKKSKTDIENRSENCNDAPKTKEQKLKKDGTPKKTKSNKKKGKKSEVYPFQIEDMKKMITYFEEKQMWQHYLIFILSCNMARRIGDTLSLTWEDIFDPQTGEIRTELQIVEQKTKKLTNPYINSTCKEAIELYIKKTGLNPAENNYKNNIFIQTSGKYEKKVLSYSGYLKALKEGAVAVGIKYNVGSHSPRKTFGKITKMIHPGDCICMETIQTIYGHSDVKTTNSYIGIDREKIISYYKDIGTVFEDYVMGDKAYINTMETPIISLDINDLRDILMMTYEAGRDNVREKDSIIHIGIINDIMSIVESLRK